MYTVYTKAFDEIMDARDAFEDFVTQNPDTQERLLQYLLTISPEIIPPITKSEKPLTILLDCSGSLRGNLIFRLTSALMALGDSLNAIGQSFEILGFTTVTWKGGQSRQRWISNERAPQPGRLCDLRHIVFKDLNTPWSDVRDTLLLLLKEGLLKENVDGEAIEWARTRMPENGRLLFISDGAPNDDSTLSVNHSHFLKHHLEQTLAKIAQDAVPFSATVLREPSSTLMFDPDFCFSVPKEHTPDEILHTLVESVNATA